LNLCAFASFVAGRIVFFHHPSFFHHWNPSAPPPAPVWSRHKPSPRRFLVFLLRLRKKTEKKKTKEKGYKAVVSSLPF
jgi:hypothetical protein